MKLLRNCKDFFIEKNGKSNGNVEKNEKVIDVSEGVKKKITFLVVFYYLGVRRPPLPP